MGKRANKHFENRFSQGFEIRFSKTIKHVAEQNHRNMNLNKAIRAVFTELLGKENIDDVLFGNKKFAQTKLPENPVILESVKKP